MCHSFELCSQESAEITLQSIRAPAKGSGPVRRSAGPHERAGIRRQGSGTDVEERRTIRRGKSKPLSGAGQVSRTSKSPNSSLPKRNCSEPQTPALPTLLLGASALLVLFDWHHARIAIQPIAPTNQLLKQKSIRTFSTRPMSFRDFLCGSTST